MSATVNVIDDDTVRTVTVADVTASEGGAGTLVFELEIDGAPAADATVVYTITTDGTADAGTDYTVGSATDTLTFARGETASKFVSIAIVDDSDDEPHETVVLTLSSPSNLQLAGGVSTISATGTILDDDMPEISVIEHASRVDESTTGPYVFSVGLTVPVGSPTQTTMQPVMFDYSIGGGSATANGAGVVGADYTIVGPASGTLEFPAGSTAANSAAGALAGARTFTVEIINDELNETDENFFFTLSNLDNAEIPGGFSSRAYAVDIVDDDGLVFEIGNLTLSEDNRTSILSVSLSAMSPDPASVRYQFIDGSATSPADYSASDGMLNFQALSTTPETISITVEDDTIDEPNETLTIRFFDPMGAALLDGESIVTTLDVDAIIGDNDTPELSISGGTAVTEGDPSDPVAVYAEFRITARNNIMPRSDLTVALDVSETPGAGDDGFVSGTDEGAQVLTFTAGTTSATYTVEIVNDEANEADGDVTVTISANDPNSPRQSGLYGRIGSR